MTAAELKPILAAHAAWLRGEPEGKRANLAGAALYGANLAGAALTGANLAWANLTGANLAGANLAEANLTKTNLAWAYLAGANLTGAYLTGDDLTGAALAGANLAGADLAEANLTGANLAGANLTGTCLDPASTPNADWPAEADAEGYVTGYRSRRFGALCGTSPRDLKDGETVRAEVFSTATTECHPGLYLWPTLDMARKWAYGHIKCGAPIVSVRVRKADIHRAGDKWRAKEIAVAGEA